ncbi:unnamed protein product [Lepeophtheirus salmonis]|uniref:(salmon louse) hypothetical protein n=1 Tax=Lepeophtheirus salmonis TaxID=72036 RepID=A0A7R8H2U6_LEPSM|nr:unnamed protein product [Lepeophtheirus salmonis]CAF2832520.1 unnamed protein product [Lepeophtheirus salmonis]
MPDFRRIVCPNSKGISIPNQICHGKEGDCRRHSGFFAETKARTSYFVSVSGASQRLQDSSAIIFPSNVAYLQNLGSNLPLNLIEPMPINNIRLDQIEPDRPMFTANGFSVKDLSTTGGVMSLKLRNRRQQKCEQFKYIRRLQRFRCVRFEKTREENIINIYQRSGFSFLHRSDTFVQTGGSILKSLDPTNGVKQEKNYSSS